MKRTSKEMYDLLAEARLNFHGTNPWQHYKGGVYEVDGFTISTDTGDVLVRYHRIDGPDFNPLLESEISFSRPLVEWSDDVDGTPRFVRAKRITMWEPL